MKYVIFDGLPPKTHTHFTRPVVGYDPDTGQPIGGNWVNVFAKDPEEKRRFKLDEVDQSSIAHHLTAKRCRIVETDETEAPPKPQAAPFHRPAGAATRSTRGHVVAAKRYDPDSGDE